MEAGSNPPDPPDSPSPGVEPSDAASRPFTRANYDLQSFKWNRRVQSADGAATVTSVSQTQIFNVDSNECTLKAFEGAKKSDSYVATAFLRSDNFKFRDTDDRSDGTGVWVTTNFPSRERAVSFFEATSDIFGECRELIADDTPRRRCVFFVGSSFGDDERQQKERFKCESYKITQAMEPEASSSDFAVSHIRMSRPPHNVFVVCHHAASDPIFSSKEHATYAQAVADRYVSVNNAVLPVYTPHNLPGSLFLERVNDTAYALVPCVLGNRTVDERTHVVRTEISIVEADRGFVKYGFGAVSHLLTTSPRPSGGVVMSYSSSLTYAPGPSTPSSDYAAEWAVGMRRLHNTLGSSLFKDPEIQFAQGGEVCSNTYGRIAVPFNAACPLCNRERVAESVPLPGDEVRREAASALRASPKAKREGEAKRRGNRVHYV